MTLTGALGFSFYLFLNSWNGGEGREFRNSFLLKYRSYCKTLTVKTHQYNRTSYTVAKRIQMLQWNSEFAWKNTDKFPSTFPLENKNKIKTNHTARILISEIFLNKLSIGQLAQLSLIISPGFSLHKDVGLLRLPASLLQVRGQVRLTVYPSSPNHTVSFHRTCPSRLARTRSPRQPYRWPRQTSPAGFCCKFSQWGPPTSCTCIKGRKKGD